MIFPEGMGDPMPLETCHGASLASFPTCSQFPASNYLTVLEVRHPKSVLLGYNRGVGKTAFFLEA